MTATLDVCNSRPTCCILFTTDPTYLFPTFVSALQARKNASAHKADVVIYCLDLDAPTEQVFRPICEAENIGLVKINQRMIEGQSAMMARLFLQRFVPSHYTDYLYMDGDVHILGSLDPLIDVNVPDQSFLAVNDPMTFLLADDTKLSNGLRSHLSSIGLGEQQSFHYFNSGVLRIRANGWEAIGAEAWRHLQRLGPGSRFPDQDALNLAGQDQRIPMSLTWNYPVFLRHSRVESDIRPRIKHFMSSPKPWHGPFPPWTQAECEPYNNALASYPALIPFRPKALSHKERAVYRLQQNGKRFMESFTWGMSKRRDRILEYQATCPTLFRGHAEESSLDATPNALQTEDVAF